MALLTKHGADAAAAAAEEAASGVAVEDYVISTEQICGTRDLPANLANKARPGQFPFSRTHLPSQTRPSPRAAPPRAGAT